MGEIFTGDKEYHPVRAFTGGMIGGGVLAILLGVFSFIEGGKNAGVFFAFAPSLVSGAGGGIAAWKKGSSTLRSLILGLICFMIGSLMTAMGSCSAGCAMVFSGVETPPSGPREIAGEIVVVLMAAVIGSFMGAVFGKTTLWRKIGP